MEHHHLPDLNGWAALKALVQTGGVSTAAKALNIGQSAVTKRLRALESCYAVPLIERIDGRLRLTVAGEKVYALAVQTLERQRSLQRELSDEANGQASIRLLATHDITEYFLPSLLLRFHANCPEYQIESRVAYYEQICEGLVTASTNLALLESAPDHPDVLVQKWADDELVLVCGRNHALAETRTLPVAELGSLRYVLRERGSSPRDSVEKTLEQAGVRMSRVELELGPTQALIDTLAQGDYVSFLPRFAVANKISSGELHHIHVSGVSIRRSLWMARNRVYLKHPVTDAFIAMLRKQAS